MRAISPRAGANHSRVPKPTNQSIVSVCRIHLTKRFDTPHKLYPSRFFIRPSSQSHTSTYNIIQHPKRKRHTRTSRYQQHCLVSSKIEGTSAIRPVHHDLDERIRGLFFRWLVEISFVAREQVESTGPVSRHADTERDPRCVDIGQT